MMPVPWSAAAPEAWRLDLKEYGPTWDRGIGSTKLKEAAGIPSGTRPSTALPIRRPRSWKLPFTRGSMSSTLCLMC